jgi:hypothetical protein
MPLKTWTTNETVDDTAFNEMIDMIPSTVCHAITPSASEFRGRTGVPNALVGTLKLRPVIGRYLHIRHEVRSHDGNAASGQYVIRHAKGTVAVFAFSGITSTTFARAQETVDMENLTIQFQPADVTNDEADLLLYLNDNAAIRSIQVYSGEASADTDYGPV